MRIAKFGWIAAVAAMLLLGLISLHDSGVALIVGVSMLAASLVVAPILRRRLVHEANEDPPSH